MGLVWVLRGALLGVLACSAAAGLAIPATAAPEVTSLTSCKTLPSHAITSPGVYRLDADISTDDRVCFDIETSDVTLDLNTHTITQKRRGSSLCRHRRVPRTAHDDIVGPGTVTGWASAVQVQGDHGSARGVTATGNDFGISIYGADNSMHHNMATDNDFGIVAEAGATHDTFTDNVARRNSADLYDVNPNCGGNVWKNNDFHVANQDCIR